MDKYQHTSIEQLPDRTDFVLEITNKKLHWFFRYGGLLVMVLIIALLITVYQAISKAGEQAAKKAAGGVHSTR